MKFTILLSTYKNRKYLNELIDSIESQTVSDWVIYWREDSNDYVGLERLQGEMQASGKAVMHKDVNSDWKNIGVKDSFMALLANAPVADYYLFCDQDDVWLPTRLESIRLYEQPSAPSIVIQNGFRFDIRRGCLGNILHDRVMIDGGCVVDNQFPGCCMAISESARASILKESSYFKHSAILHDWVAVLVAYKFDWKVFIELQPKFKYRLHEDNAVGLPGPFAKLFHLLKNGQLFRYVEEYSSILGGNLIYVFGDQTSSDKHLSLLKSIMPVVKHNKIRFVFILLLIPFVIHSRRKG